MAASPQAHADNPLLGSLYMALAMACYVVFNEVPNAMATSGIVLIAGAGLYCLFLSQKDSSYIGLPK